MTSGSGSSLNWGGRGLSRGGDFSGSSHLGAAASAAGVANRSAGLAAGVRPQAGQTTLQPREQAGAAAGVAHGLANRLTRRSAHRLAGRSAARQASLQSREQTGAAARIASRFAGRFADSRGTRRSAGGRGAGRFAGGRSTGGLAADRLAEIRLQASQSTVQPIKQAGTAAGLATARLAGGGDASRRLAAAAQPASLDADRERRDDRDSQKGTTQHGTLLVRKNQRDTFCIGRLCIGIRLRGEPTIVAHPR